MPVQLTQSDFGTFADKATGAVTAVKKFTWTTDSKFSVEVITYGATITAIKVPDRRGIISDVALGFENMEGYLNPLNPYFGATIGRAANRIANAKMTILGETYELSANRGKIMLHGGFRGFDKFNWNYYVDGTSVTLSHYSQDGNEGFPGDVITNVTFDVDDNDELSIKYKATTTKPTYVNMTNHSYFNLAGHDKGATELYKHEVTINADRILELDETLVPTGNFLRVADTAFDLRSSKILGEIIGKLPNQPGFDNNYCVTKGTKQEETFVARVYHPDSGRVLEVYSNQPGVQFYTGNFLPEDPKTLKSDGKNATSLEGKGAKYYKHGAFCLETQNYPDAINHTNFPKAVLHPGEVYYHTVKFAFSVKA